MTTYVAFSTAWPLRKSNAIALTGEEQLRAVHDIQHSAVSCHSLRGGSLSKIC
jgi:hypothetical protein